MDLRDQIKTAYEKLAEGGEETRFHAVKDLIGMVAPETLPILIQAAGDKSYRVREAALTGLCSFPSEQIFPRLTDLLRDNENANLRNAAIEVFPRYGETAIPHLLGLLKDWDEEVRMFSASMLGDVADPRGVDGLIEALSDQDENVRHAAAESLGKICDARSVAPLLDCLTHDFWVQYPAIIALGDIKDPRAVKPLLDLINDEMLRPAVIESLGKIGDPSAIPVLAELLNQNDASIRNDTIAALVNIQRLVKPEGGPLTSIKTALDNGALVDHLLASLDVSEIEVKKNAVIALGWLREARAVPALIERLNDYDLEEYAVGSLVSIGASAVSELVKGLSNPDPQIQCSLVRCLDWIGEPEGIKACLPLLASPTVEIRRQALMAMGGALDHEQVRQALLGRLDDPDPEIGNLLIEVLGRAADPDLTATLLTQLDRLEPLPLLRAIITLGRRKDPQTAAALWKFSTDACDQVRAEVFKSLAALASDDLPGRALLQGLSDPSPAVRKSVARAVPEAADALVEKALIALIEDADPEVRLAVVEALGRIGGAASLQRLTAGFDGYNKSQRLAIVRALGNIRDKSVAAFLGGLLREPDPDLKRAALESLGDLKDPRSLSDVLVALDDSDWSVRSAALTTLARLDDPRCSTLVLEKLEDPEDLVKKQAIITLGELRVKEAVNFILPHLHNDNLQLEIIKTLERLGVPDFDFFTVFFARCNTRLKCRLIDLLGRLSDRRYSIFLAAALEKEFFTVRARAARALGELGDRAVVGPLVRAQREDPSDEVQREAALALRKLDARK